METKNYTIQVRVHCTIEDAKRIADLIQDYADDVLEDINTDTVLCDDQDNEIE